MDLPNGERPAGFPIVTLILRGVGASTGLFTSDADDMRLVLRAFGDSKSCSSSSEERLRLDESSLLKEEGTMFSSSELYTIERFRGVGRGAARGEC